MSNKIKVKIEFLVQGFYPIEGNFELDNFQLCENVIDEKLIDYIESRPEFYIPSEIFWASYQRKDEKLSYLTFKNEHYILELEKDISQYDKCMLGKIIAEKFYEIKKELQRKLQLITNLNIVLSRGFVETKYLDNKIKKIVVDPNNSYLRVQEYTSNQIYLLENRLARGFSLENLKKYSEKNESFGRALDFYFDSFLTNNLEVRFTLLIVSLEALFNLDGKYIRKNISKYGSKILFLDKNEEKEIFNILFDYYKRRSYFIHGNNPIKINNSDEFHLREILRKILLIYWMIMVTEQLESSKKIIEYIDSIKDRDKLNMMLQTFIISLEKESFEEIKIEVLNNIFKN